jgi:hypothetical protein
MNGLESETNDIAEQDVMGRVVAERLDSTISRFKLTL